MNEEMLICNCYSQCGCENLVEEQGEDCEDCFGSCTPPPLNAETEQEGVTNELR
jgi:hypothetical protein